MKKLFTILMLIGCVIMSSFVTSPFSTIVSPIASSYNTYQVKITYLDAQLRARPSLLLFGSGRSPNMAEFAPYRSSSISYQNDEAGFLPVSVSGTSIKKFVDALNLKPEIKVIGGGNTPFVSLMIQKGIAPGEFVFEHIADYPEAQTIYNLLEGAIATESAAAKLTVRKFRNFTLGPH